MAFCGPAGDHRVSTVTVVVEARIQQPAIVAARVDTWQPLTLQMKATSSLVSYQEVVRVRFSGCITITCSSHNNSLIARRLPWRCT